MKLAAVPFTILLFFLFPVAYAQGVTSVPSSKNPTLLVFKVDKKFKGGEVEVLSASGDSVTKQILHKRKMKIDFRNAKSGAYTIKVKKGMLVEQLQYQKR